MKSLEELRQIKEKALKEINLRNTHTEKKISVAMGTAGIAAGARETANAFLDELYKNGIYDVPVRITAGAGDDVPAPVVYVTRGEDEVTYVNLTADKVAKVVNEHIVNGNAVTEYAADK